MKKILFLLIAGLLSSIAASANYADFFTYNEDQVTQEMSELQALEDFVSLNPGITFSALQAENNSLVDGLDLSAGEYGGIGSMSGEPALGIPSFLWGCVLGWVGILVVHLVAEDKDETRKAAVGCVVGYLTDAVITVVFYVIYFGFLFSWGYYY